MLEEIKEICSPYELLRGNYGIERETLRIYKDGSLSETFHPEVFGSKSDNPYITTDFAECQVEMITPPLNTPQQVYDFTNALYDISVSEIGNEYLWPQSMPSIVPNDDEIRIARYDNNEKGNIAYEYRKNLIKKYGGKRQLICGIHYNFSFDENLIRKLYKYEINVEDSKENVSYKNFKNTIYLKIARNYLRYRWLIVYLLGASNIVHKTYGCRCCMNISKEIARETFTNEGAVSYRNSDCGYRNKIELIPDYSSVENYIGSLKSFINDELIATVDQNNGTTRIMKNPYVKVAAKSGSAQNPHSKLTHAWVAGYFPADKDPEVVFVCLLEGAGGGGVMAGGMAKRFLDKYLEVEKGIEPVQYTPHIEPKTTNSTIQTSGNQENEDSGEGMGEERENEERETGETTTSEGEQN